MISLEVCIHSKSDTYVTHSVSEAWKGGADRIELCSHMEQDGLTPSIAHIELAREAFKDRSGLLAMVRPTGGDFFYNLDEINLMDRQIVDAAKAGVNGVVIGVLDKGTGSIHRDYCYQLVERAREYELAVTFHRAFDAIGDWKCSLDTLVELGVDRVLSSGIPWGHSGTALDGVERLIEMGKYVSGELEIVVGGGVSRKNTAKILAGLRPEITNFSLHAYSAMLEAGNVDFEKVHELKSMLTEET
ncbi:copper homeostasis protein CutC [Endozoicomonas sp.]|uniref:copper homeostasis protein CutC n=1 Tax=Endozoicomonas sp. TaxID=1892382 RepID=UPI003AF5D6A6